MKKELKKETEKSIEKYKCKKCGGIIAKSYSMAMMAMLHGKKCNCKSQK
jgi:hypothetical protein